MGTTVECTFRRMRSPIVPLTIAVVTLAACGSSSSSTESDDSAPTVALTTPAETATPGTATTETATTETRRTRQRRTSPRPALRRRRPNPPAPLRRPHPRRRCPNRGCGTVPASMRRSNRRWPRSPSASASRSRRRPLPPRSSSRPRCRLRMARSSAPDGRRSSTPAATSTGWSMRSVSTQRSRPTSCSRGKKVSATAGGQRHSPSQGRSTRAC